MISKLTKISKNFYVLRFSYSKAEVKDFVYFMSERLYEEEDIEEPSDDELEFLLHLKLENDDLFKEFHRYNLVPIGGFDITYHTKFSRDSEYIGSCRFIACDKLLDKIDLKFDYKKYQKLIDKDKYPDTSLKLLYKKCIKKDLFNEIDSDIVTFSSIVTYDLKYIEDEKVLSVISDQRFDMIIDTDIDSNLFLNKKIGDKILVSKEDYDIYAIITKIKERTFDINSISKLKIGIKSEKKLVDEFIDTHYMLVNRIYHVWVLANGFLEKTGIEISDEILDFFSETKNYCELTNFTTLDTSFLQDVEFTICVDYLFAYINMNNSFEINNMDSFHNTLIKSLKVFNLNKNINDFELYFIFKLFNIVKYFCNE